ncbi:hypothetical protein [Deinococcus deserti]|uniref:Uncharacterized protein n=1 Tax=Deinococcus deserti (strain DSM 17065 / CIP 109153 / LMG 22923 / VCD115) TaxID=546414 RepID=C1D261_DEIDV|nr:hypothetical protein [Deinococcus deserti]ACO47500.1 Hypothetical protein, precursor [Deinococcus deserti VCD115]
MNSLYLSATMVLGSLVLSGCEAAERKHYEQRQLTLDRNNAQFYLSQCVQAIERRRAQPGVAQGRLPRKLDGTNCENPLLGDYALDPAQGRIIEKSVIRLDSSRLSSYTIEVHGRDGEVYTYVDRGRAAAEAEQAGTFADSSAGGTVSPPPDVTEGEPNRPEVEENQSQ